MNKATISLTREATEAAKAEIRKAFEAGAAGTIGDSSDSGFLYYILIALDCDFGNRTHN